MMSRGHLYWILSNPIYIGRLRHKGQIHDGLHEAIIDPPTWDRVQARLASQTQTRKVAHPDDQSFLAGKLYDDRGHRMGPSHAAKGGRRWRYFVSRALLKGRMQDAGSLARVPAAEIEKEVFEAVKAALASHDLSIKTSSEGSAYAAACSMKAANNERIGEAIERVTIGRRGIEVQLKDAVVAEGQDRTLVLPWTPSSPRRRREIIQGEGRPASLRPMRVRARAVFLLAVRNAHRWLDELMTDPNQTIESLAAREGKSERSIRMTLSLAFVAPPIVTAAIE